MTNTLHALIERILDVTVAHLLIARERLAIRPTDRLQSRLHSVRNRQHVAAEGNQIAGGEAKIGGTLARVMLVVIDT